MDGFGNEASWREYVSHSEGGGWWMDGFTGYERASKQVRLCQRGLRVEWRIMRAGVWRLQRPRVLGFWTVGGRCGRGKVSSVIMHRILNLGRNDQIDTRRP